MKPEKDSPVFAEAITVEEMRAYDAYTIEHFISGRELMHRAAMGVYKAADWENKRIAILSGSGNNGGDGYALACILAEHGIFADILRTSSKVSEDGAYYLKKSGELGVATEFFTEDTDLTGYDILVDCMLGTGFQGEPRETVAEAIRRINETPSYVISVDINSGMNGDTGEAVLAVRSDLTVSVGFYKKGHFLGKGPEYIGELVNVDIGIVRPPQYADCDCSNI